MNSLIEKDGKSGKPRHIILLGASVGKAWNISQLPKRISNGNYRFEYVGLYQFDKSCALNELLQRNENKPDAIFIKECAAYFPSDTTFKSATLLIKLWVRSCKEKEVLPILTTVCPITRSRDEKFKTRNPLKRLVKTIRGQSMQTCMDRICEYNDWIKSYANENNLPVLDLETPLRINMQERYLRDNLTKGDGLHLNSTAYRILDAIVIPTLAQINWERTNNN